MDQGQQCYEQGELSVHCPTKPRYSVVLNIIQLAVCLYIKVLSSEPFRVSGELPNRAQCDINLIKGQWFSLEQGRPGSSSVR